MLTPVIWYCAALAGGLVVVSVSFRVKGRAAVATQTLALWLTSLTILPIWKVEAPPHHLTTSSVVAATAFVIGGSLLFFGIAMPRVTGASLRQVGWVSTRLRRVSVGGLFGLLLAFVMRPSSGWEPAPLAAGLNVRLVFLLAVYGLGTAWQEETLFRGYIQTFLRECHNTTSGWPIMVQSLLFGASPIAIAIISGALMSGRLSLNAVDLFIIRFAAFHVLLGLATGYMRDRYGTILPSYVAHVLYSWIGILMMRL
jgi:membrane protease YdiL (CAAX protease family)